MKATRLAAACALLTLSSAAWGCSAGSKPPPPDSKIAGVTPLARVPEIRTVWRRELHEVQRWDYKPLEYATPVYLKGSHDLVVGTSGGRVYRLDAGSGRTVSALKGGSSGPETPWEINLKRTIHARPVRGGDLIFVGTLSGTVHALRLDDGSIQWQGLVQDAVESDMAFALDRLFFADASETLYALDAATGKILWRYKRETPEYFLLKGAGAPTVVEDTVYVGFADGHLAALQVDGGEELWATDLSADKLEFIDVDLAPIVRGTSIWAVSYAGGLFRLDLEGNILWNRPVESISDMVYAEEKLYLTTAQGRVQALEADTGQAIWSFRFRRDSPVRLAVSNDYVLVSTAAGPLMILDRATGYPLRRWSPSTGFNTEVVIARNRGYLFSNGGYLYSFRLGY